jgi:hypothetical protein
MLNFGVFYQSGHKDVACFYALERLRSFYPNIPVVFYEDGGSNTLKPVSDFFNCHYRKTKLKGENYESFGKPVFDFESSMDYIDRIYKECQTTLKDVEWVMIFEDDIWVEREIIGTPPYDLTGIHNYYVKQELKDFIGSKLDSNFGRGGSMFKRQVFIDLYEEWKNIKWDEILSLDKSVVEWSDILITFYFDYFKKTIGGWEELINCTFITYDIINIRESWKTHPHEVDSDTDHSSIIHGYKGYYFPTEEEINYYKKIIYNV